MDAKRRRRTCHPLSRAAFEKRRKAGLRVSSLIHREREVRGRKAVRGRRLLPVRAELPSRTHFARSTGAKRSRPSPALPSPPETSQDQAHSRQPQKGRERERLSDCRLSPPPPQASGLPETCFPLAQVGNTRLAMGRSWRWGCERVPMTLWRRHSHPGRCRGHPTPQGGGGRHSAVCENTPAWPHCALPP
jgi:hypothetical protein